MSGSFTPVWGTVWRDVRIRGTARSLGEAPEQFWSGLARRWRVFWTGIPRDDLWREPADPVHPRVWRKQTRIRAATIAAWLISKLNIVTFLPRCCGKVSLHLLRINLGSKGSVGGQGSPPRNSHEAAQVPPLFSPTS